MPSLCEQLNDMLFLCFYQDKCIVQGSYGSWKTWKVLKFYYGIFQDWKVLEKATGPGKFWKSVKLN